MSKFLPLSSPSNASSSNKSSPVPSLSISDIKITNSSDSSLDPVEPRIIEQLRLPLSTSNLASSNLDRADLLLLSSVIIIDDDPKCIVAQMEALLKVGVKPSNIKVFWLNTKHLEGGSGISVFMSCGSQLFCYSNIRDVTAQIAESITQDQLIHMLLDMDMDTTDEVSSRLTGARILESIIQNPDLRKAMLDKRLGVTITSSNDIGAIFEQGVDRIELGDDQFFNIVTDANAKQIKFISDKGEKISVCKAAESKFGKQCIQIIKVLAKNSDNIAKYPNMVPLFDFLKGLGIADSASINIRSNSDSDGSGRSDSIGSNSSLKPGSEVLEVGAKALSESKEREYMPGG